MTNTPENKAIFLSSCLGEFIFEENISEMKTWHIHSVDMKGNVSVIHTKDDTPTTIKESVLENIAVAKKPLSYISNEDAIEASKHISQMSFFAKKKWNVSHVENGEASYVLVSSKRSEHRFEIDYDGLLHIKHEKTLETPVMALPDYLSAFDFLRRKGYALPFQGVSVETLVEWGWIKLKEYSNTKTTTNVTC